MSRDFQHPSAAQMATYMARARHERSAAFAHLLSGIWHCLLPHRSAGTATRLQGGAPC